MFVTNQCDFFFVGGGGIGMGVGGIYPCPMPRVLIRHKEQVCTVFFIFRPASFLPPGFLSWRNQIAFHRRATCNTVAVIACRISTQFHHGHVLFFSAVGCLTCTHLIQTRYVGWNLIRLRQAFKASIHYQTPSYDRGTRHEVVMGADRL